ncbi:MAG: hypothetical protein HC903_03800 [Methylacidiphilales bacterium]|nr:hypothetical protein [Candidatus Methylacidiphilales bacterium]NJR14294.1 hypothetical protein [Calothrix sp. CSU_2_0]
MVPDAIVGCGVNCGVGIAESTHVTGKSQKCQDFRGWGFVKGISFGASEK